MATSDSFGTTDPYATGKSNVDAAAGIGTSAIGSFDPNAWASNTQNGLTSLWNGQNNTQDAYITAYKNAIASNPSATDLYTKANSIFNVPALQQTSNTLNNAMLEAPNSNIAAARGFNVDQNQIDQKTSQDLQRLAPAAAAAQNNANTAMTNAGNYVTAGMQQNQLNLLPIQEQGSYLMDAFARQQSGFTTTAQSQLASLQAKMESGERLSEAEMSAYATLTSAEEAYNAAKMSANASVTGSQLSNNYQILKPSEGLYSAMTGKITPYNG